MSIQYREGFQMRYSTQRSPNDVSPQSSTSTNDESPVSQREETVGSAINMNGIGHTLNSIHTSIESSCPKYEKDNQIIYNNRRQSSLPSLFPKTCSRAATTSTSTSSSCNSRILQDMEKDMVDKETMDFTSTHSQDAGRSSKADTSDKSSTTLLNEIQSTVQVVFLGAPQSGKTSIVESLRWGNATQRTDYGRTTLAPPSCKDGRWYNVHDMSVGTNLEVLLSIFTKPESLVVLVWNMGVNNPNTFHVKSPTHSTAEAKKKKRKAMRALDRDIDDTVQFWIDNVHKHAPGASILLVASFDDMFVDSEATRRCMALQKRLEKNASTKERSKSLQRIYPAKGNPCRRISCTTHTGLGLLKDDIIYISDGLRDRHGGYLTNQNNLTLSYIKQLHSTFRSYSTSNSKSFVNVDELFDCNINAHQSALAQIASRYLSAIGEVYYYGKESQKGEMLDGVVVINHMLLVEAAKSILNHHNFLFFQTEVEEAKIDLGERDIREGVRVIAEHCSACQIPIVTRDEIALLWQISDTFLEYTDKQKAKLFGFFHELMVKYSALIPIKIKGTDETLYLLPKLLEMDDLCDTWTYKCGESWKTTLCYSWLLSDIVPSDFMIRVITAVVQDLIPYIMQNEEDIDNDSSSSKSNSRTGTNSNSNTCVREILCGKTSIYLKLGSKTAAKRENIMEILIHLAEQDSPICVASSTMVIGTRRLIVSAKGAIGAEGRMIWNGGFDLIINTMDKVLSTFTGLKVEKEIVCPDCLASHKPVSQASVWKWDAVNGAADRDQEEIRCRNAHPVKIPFIIGRYKDMQHNYDFTLAKYETCAQVSNLLCGVVLVGLLDKKNGRILRAGSGFVVDTNSGLIVTASHTLINMDNSTADGTPNTNFGEWYYGLEDAEVVIGVIPSSNDGESKTAVYRYFAKVLMADVRNVDACVLWITKKLETDLEMDAEIGEDHLVEDVRYKPQGYFVNEGLTQLSMTTTCEYEERVRVLGYNQGGEGLLERGTHVNRTADFSVGYVCKKFQCVIGQKDEQDEFFRPREEIVVIRCPTIGGHSGGPCVNQIGKVIGILSRSDPAEAQRCYIAPSSEFSELVRMAKGRVKFVRRLQNIML